MTELEAIEAASDLATALGQALKGTRYRRATVQITPRGGTEITFETGSAA